MVSDQHDLLVVRDLHKTISWMDLVLANLKEGVVVIDERLCILYCNSVFAGMVGQDRIYLLGQRLSDVLALTHDGKPIPKESHPWTSLGKQTQSHQWITVGGEQRWCEIVVVPLLPLEQAVIIVRDETEQKKAGEELESANKELEAFSFSVSHDLRAPLRAIHGFSKAIQEDCAAQLDSEGQRYLKLISDNTQTMGQLIDDLLSFSRLGRHAMSSSGITMDSLAEDVFQELKGRLSAREILWVKGRLLPAHGDRAMIRQVLVNLLSNAVKFTSTKAAAVIEMTSHAEGDQAVYCVKDNGVGFDMKFIDKLFGVFQRLHSVEEFEGTGVGLAIVQRVVHRHGGRVWAEGKLGVGAAFYFTLPRGSHDNGHA